MQLWTHKVLSYEIGANEMIINRVNNDEVKAEENRDPIDNVPNGVERDHLPSWIFYQIDLPQQSDSFNAAQKPKSNNVTVSGNADTRTSAHSTTQQQKIHSLQRLYKKHHRTKLHEWHSRHGGKFFKWQQQLNENPLLVNPDQNIDDYKTSLRVSKSPITGKKKRSKRNTRDEYSLRHKRDLDADSQAGLIIGGVVLGLLTATLIICACLRSVYGNSLLSFFHLTSHGSVKKILFPRNETQQNMTLFVNKQKPFSFETAVGSFQFCNQNGHSAQKSTQMVSMGITATVVCTESPFPPKTENIKLPQTQCQIGCNQRTIAYEPYIYIYAELFTHEPNLYMHNYTT